MSPCVSSSSYNHHSLCYPKWAFCLAIFHAQLFILYLFLVWIRKSFSYLVSLLYLSNKSNLVQMRADELKRSESWSSLPNLDWQQGPPTSDAVFSSFFLSFCFYLFLESWSSLPNFDWHQGPPTSDPFWLFSSFLLSFLFEGQHCFFHLFYSSTRPPVTARSRGWWSLEVCELAGGGGAPVQFVMTCPLIPLNPPNTDTTVGVHSCRSSSRKTTVCFNNTQPFI